MAVMDAMEESGIMNGKSREEKDNLEYRGPKHVAAERETVGHGTTGHVTAEREKVGYGTLMNNVPIREVDTAAYLDVMKELVQEGRSVSIIVSGNSMSPFLIHRRDRVFFEKPNRPLRRGDIVFYQREGGRYIMHRIWKVKKEGYYIVGDAQTEIEGPVKPEQIFALITKCERKGKMITSGSFWWEFFEKVWIRMVPVRPLVRGVYTWMTSFFRK